MFVQSQSARWVCFERYFRKYWYHYILLLFTLLSEVFTTCAIICKPQYLTFLILDTFLVYESENVNCILEINVIHREIYCYLCGLHVLWKTVLISFFCYLFFHVFLNFCFFLLVLLSFLFIIEEITNQIKTYLNF